MKSTKIKLNSRHLKVGDKIIRVKPLSSTERSFITQPFTVTNKNKFHIKGYLNYPEHPQILPISEWNDGNWVRYTLDEKESSTS